MCLDSQYKEYHETKRCRGKGIIDNKIHKVRANAFYELLKENSPKTLSFCFIIDTPSTQNTHSRRLLFTSN